MTIFGTVLKLCYRAPRYPCSVRLQLQHNMPSCPNLKRGQIAVHLPWELPLEAALPQLDAWTDPHLLVQHLPRLRVSFPCCRWRLHRRGLLHLPVVRCCIFLSCERIRQPSDQPRPQQATTLQRKQAAKTSLKAIQAR